MSRSNPNENGAVHPCTRWFEWNGEAGTVRYYNKDEKQNVDVGTAFTFILLDQLGAVGGWHEASTSSIYSNEVKDTRQDVLVVKSFRGGVLAEGLYKDIKDRVHTLGGQFVANCYIAYKADDDVLKLGAIKFKGAALAAWMEFSKKHRADLYKKAVKITGFTEGKKGRVVFRVPVMELANVSATTDALAVSLDKALQDFLSAYLKRTKRDQVDTTAQHVADESFAGAPEDDGSDMVPPLTDDDIPF